MSAMTAADQEWDLLVSAVNRHGVTYMAPGAEPSEPPPEGEELFRRLATSQHVRLREAIVTLLLAHPELAPDAARAIAGIDGERGLQAKLRYSAACALQRMWRTRLSEYFGDQPLLPTVYFGELGLPSAELDFGVAALLALSNREEELFGYNAWDGYDSLMNHFLGDLAVHAGAR